MKKSTAAEEKFLLHGMEQNSLAVLKPSASARA
jgi:hypothetical protein